MAEYLRKISKIDAEKAEELIDTLCKEVAEALKLLEKRLSENGNIKDGQKRMAEYLRKISKIDAEKAEELIDTLCKEVNLTRTIAVQIVNLMPTHIEELRSILPSDKYFSREELEKILKILK
jgi:DNA-directed RNA polymerase subunit F